MKKNDIFEIEITGVTDEGDGVGRAENIAVFVPFALQGERVEVLIIKTYKTYAIGKLQRVISPSPDRIKSDCEHFYKCGGCSFQNVNYDTELSFKEKAVTDAVRRIGKCDCEILPILGAKNQSCYRNKAQFPVGTEGIGLYARKSHRIIDMNFCSIQDEKTAIIIKIVRKWMADFGVPAYDELADTGLIRHIYTRVGNNKMLLCIVSRKAEIPHIDELISALLDTGIEFWGIILNVNEKQTNVVLGKKSLVLYGKDYMFGKIGDCEFKVSHLSFWQVNSAQTKVLYDVVKDFASLEGNEVVWDLYCGIGTIGQYMGKNAKKLIGIEIVPEAIDDAKENAKRNGISDFEYYCGTAESLASSIKDRPDLIILDPPRKGCDRELIDTVIKTGVKKIVYVSCKASTLARDLEILEKNGYKATRIQPVDLFPRTNHCEAVAEILRVK
ncbi:MAG: 23S rRNA (uracil(1939)-C(5))-methyltransferase RlmD [Clostridia bacterium]|nr:23S rRNA (uracil(1939)-C(5))-methyltransferase RlmD [Clostridia bacterium]